MNIIITPETLTDWPTVVANDITAGVIWIVQFKGSRNYVFQLHDSSYEKFSPLEVAQIRRVADEAAAVLTVTTRLTS